MGRKSSLTEKQWSEIERRLIAGEKGRALAKEFGISEAAIRKRCGAQTKQIKDVANQLVAAETAFSALPISAQISARTLADELKEISMQLAGAARYSAATAHRLFDAINNTQTENPNAIVVTLTPSQIATGLYLGGVVADSVDVQVVGGADGVVYNKSTNLNMSNSGSSFWGWCFNRIRRKNFFVALDLPAYWEGVVTVSINKPGGVAKCGMCSIGPLTDLGFTQYGLGLEEKDYSSTRFDVDGESETTVRGYSKVLTLDVVIYNDQIDTAVDQMTDYRQRNVVWIGESTFGHTIVFGKRSTFKSVIADWPTSRMALKIDGVI
jgi:hypothetical protein